MTPRITRISLYCLPVLFGLLLSANTVWSSAPPSLRTIALTGDSAVGIPGDERFQWFGGNPGIGVSAPWTDPDGDVGFAAGWTQEINPHGIWRERNSSLELIAVAGDPAPGTDVDWNGFPIFFPTSPKVDGTNASFLGTLPGNPSERGVWIQRGEEIELVFRQNDPPPGAQTGAHWFDWVHATEGGTVVVNGRYSVAGVPSHQGFWKDRTGDLELFVMSGDPAPGTDPGVVFGNATASAFLVFQSWDLDGDGRIVFHAQIQGPGITATEDEGIWMETAEGLQLVVLEGDRAPGLGSPNARFLGNSGFRTFDHDDVLGVFLNNAGHLVFGARVDVPGADNVANVVYSTRSGNLEPIAVGRYPGSNPPGDHAPGFPADATFARFAYGALKDDDEIAFTAGVADPDSQYSTDLAYGIWKDLGSGIELVVKDGDPVPNAPGLTFYQPVNGPFLADGTLLFLSRLSDGSARGLFIADPDGKIHTVARPGASFEAPHMGGAKVVADVTVGAGTAEAIAWPFTLFFTDGSSGVFSVVPGTETAVGPGPLAAGGIFRLLAASPNPFNGKTSISFRLTRTAPVKVGIYDILGRVVRTLVDGKLDAGEHEFLWDGTSRGGEPVGSGVYFIRAHGGGVETTRKILLAK
jgi:hypothetical protein